MHEDFVAMLPELLYCSFDFRPGFLMISCSDATLLDFICEVHLDFFVPVKHCLQCFGVGYVNVFRRLTWSCAGRVCIEVSPSPIQGERALRL